MQKPTRRVRRVVRRFGKSKGKGRLWTFKGKGKGPTIQSSITDYEQAGQLSHLFYGGKGKGSSKGKRSSGFGKGRRGNPTGPDGNKLRCHNCGSEDHFKRDCTSSQMASWPAGNAAASAYQPGFSMGYVTMETKSQILTTSLPD